MRRFVSAFAVLALVVPAGAQDFSDPRAVVEALYAPYFQPADSFDYARLDAAPLQSIGLNALFARDREEAGEGIGRIDFDPYVNGQDFDLGNLAVGDPVYVGGRAVVGVSGSSRTWATSSSMRVATGRSTTCGPMARSSRTASRTSSTPRCRNSATGVPKTRPSRLLAGRRPAWCRTAQPPGA